MATSSRLLRRLAVVTAVTLATPTAAATASVTPDDPARDIGPGVYVVTLVERPAAAYSGGVPGFLATRPRDGERFDADRPAVRAYRDRLVSLQERLLEDLGNPEVLYRYTTAANGFAARLSGSQVKQLRSTPGVSLVERSRTQRVDTVGSPGFLGADRAWARVGGPEAAGRGTVVGIVDTGIWPENPSFAGLPQREPGASGPRGFQGACVPAEQWAADDCSTKVVSARWFVKGFGAENLAEAEYLSARDGSGHGSHVAAIAAGNDETRVRIDGQDFGNASGMAPAARLAVYKACWSAPDPDDDGCTTADTVAAVDRAVADGVDVLGYSASTPPGGPAPVTDSLELAFLNAASAGVFVATSAGNGGPTPSTVAHPSPWVATVGASTHHLRQGALRLGDGSAYVGAMVSDTRVPRSDLVLSTDVAAEQASTEAARLCEVGALDASKAQGKIVVCDRGTIPRVDKSASVAAAGGVAMVLANTAPDTVEADVHAVPTVHLDAAAADEVKAYLEERPDATASLDPEGRDGSRVPRVAEFSGRGPAADSDVLKPDLTAPGVSVVSAVAPPTSFGHLWDLSSGTSASAPHVAGLAALVAAEHPGWSPAAVKSAMMTTATALDGRADPFAEGAGLVSGDLLDPGLVLDLDRGDYLRYLHGLGFRNADGSPLAARGIAGSRLNLPSVAVGGLAGVARVTRTVTNVAGSSETYTSRVTGLGGVDVRVVPQQLTVDPGETARFRVIFRTEPGAQLDAYTEGHLTWTGLSHQVRIPVAVRPSLVSAPEEVTASTTDRSVSVTGVSGTGRAVPLTSAGLVPAEVTSVSLAAGELDPSAPNVDADTARFPLTVPAGTEVVRLELDSLRHTDDTDLLVYRAGELVASATSGSGDETVTLVDPQPGAYDVYAHVAATEEQAPASADLFTWVVPDSDAGNLALSADAVAVGAGRRFRLELSWGALSLDRRWFGAVRYGESDHRTLVSLR